MRGAMRSSRISIRTGSAGLNSRTGILRLLQGLRLDQGGHEVPVERIAPRYERALSNALLARRIADEVALRQIPVRACVPGAWRAMLPVSVRSPAPDWLRRAFGPEIDEWLYMSRR